MKCIVQNYRKSINESDFTPEQIAIIWDFYVTKSLTSSSSQSRKVAEYGCKQLSIKEMLKIAAITNNKGCILMADSILQTLKNNDLQICEKNGTPIPIDIDTPRFALIMNYTISDNEKPKPKPGHSKPKCLLAHIRNALSHGNTYFFDNGNMLLVDEYNDETTGTILIKQKTLLDWIALIDKDKKFYQI